MAASLSAGVYATLVTPLDEGGRLAEAALERLVQRLSDKPLAGFGVLGSTGECPSLDDETRQKTMSRVRALVKHLPLVCGVIETALSGVLDGIARCADAGMDAVLLPPPFYYPLGDSAVRRFYELAAERSPLPLVLYNIPQYTKVVIPVAVVEYLAEHPRVVGIKDSSGDLRYFQACVESTAERDFLCLTGNDDLLLAALSLGGQGLIGGSCNVAADAAIAVYQAFTQGDGQRARWAQRQLTNVVRVIDRLGAVPALKAALEATGVTPCKVAAPALDLGDTERGAIKKALRELAKAFPDAATNRS